jgi:hypothetical protein
VHKADLKVGLYALKVGLYALKVGLYALRLVEADL